MKDDKATEFRAADFDRAAQELGERPDSYVTPSARVMLAGMLYRAAEIDQENDRLRRERVGGADVIAALRGIGAQVHAANAKWWRDLDTGQPLTRNVGELLMLMVSELAEAMEGHRKSLRDDKLPHRLMIEVELADCMIRIFDAAHGLGLDLGGAFAEKMEYNRTRTDHTHEARKAAGGKKY